MQRSSTGAFAAGAVTLTGLTVSTDGIVATGATSAGAFAPSGAGTRMVWNPRRAAFRAGTLDIGGTQWNDASLGFYSFAVGSNTTASGLGSFAAGASTVASATLSTAMGFASQATGSWATAIGFQTTSSGQASTAMGYQTTATADGATAIGHTAQANGVGALAFGYQTTASGEGAMALGVSTTASGVGSTALGSYASTAGFEGSLVFGDRSTTSNVEATATNQFVVRASGGTTFYSNSGLTTGVSLAPGGGSWDIVSDRARKQDFRTLDGDLVLARIKALPIQEWSYIAQGSQVRHVGPIAQDFRAAFGLGTSELTINSGDLSGINMLAIQQLIERTESLKAENAALRDEVAEMKRRLERVEELLRRP